MEYLYEKLLKYSRMDYYAFHMPGHKRNLEFKDLTGCNLPYELDITEIEGFDDLHYAKGVLKEAQDRAAELYHAQESCFLINGSTSGILSAILGCTSRGDKILVARNSHKSVYHAIFMNALRPVYLYPSYHEDVELNGAIDVLEVEAALLKHRDIKAAIITSPTYDGVVSPVEAIAGTLHKRGIPLIVDEAHGAHFGFHSYFPSNANVLGADVVIHSLHKTLPALTQCALIHMNGMYVDRGGIRQYLHMLQTSSPSYVLMASIDSCMKFLSEDGEKCFEEYAKLLANTRNELKKLVYLKIIETELFDKSKILISVKGTGMTGRELYARLLNEYHLQMEMAAGTYIIAMTSVADTENGMRRLTEALKEIDSCQDSKVRKAMNAEKMDKLHFAFPKLEQVYTSSMIKQVLARQSKGYLESLTFADCEGRVSAEYAYLYPPGIPLLVPGERISREAVRLLLMYEAMKFTIEGIEREGKVNVLLSE